MAEHDPAGRTDAREGERPALRPRGWWPWIRSIALVLCLIGVFRAYVVEAFRIPTGSMEPTLLVGDFLLVNKAVYGFRFPFTQVRSPSLAEPRRGEIVVFAPPHDASQNYVKRLVGQPGDTVSMRQRTIYVNGVAVREPYARYTDNRDLRVPAMDWQCRFRPISGSCHPSRDVWGPIVVPPGRFLVLGDNRDDSEDSRYWGFVDRGAIKGRPMVVYFSFDPNDGPVAWMTGIRWNRLGSALH